jgi:transposase-like protein
MVRTHPSTPEERAQWASLMIAHTQTYGLVTRLSREIGVSRPTLYAWRQRAQQALREAFTPTLPPPPAASQLDRHVLTVLVEGHASERGIRTCLHALTQQGIGIERISAILHDAQKRALSWMATHVPAGLRALALDEIFANDRRGAYLNAVDVHSGAVWASAGPLPVDTDSWTLVLWDLEERGLRWDRVVADDGAAIAAACRNVTPTIIVQRDQWHEWATCAQLQARLDRDLAALEGRTPVVQRQAARLAAGHKPKGRNPKTDVAAHAAEVALAQHLAGAVRFLTQEIHRLLDVVVLDRRGLLDPARRQADLESALDLLAEVASTAPAAQQAALQALTTRLRKALPELLTFVAPVQAVQQELQGVLPPAHQELLAWAWLHRQPLGWQQRDLVAALPAGWRAGARILLATWADAVRVSSAVERWHSILRPHLAVHRTLSSGMLAVLAVWHNHRVFSRGIHKGKSPLHLSGMTDAPTDWLVALGYPPDKATDGQQQQDPGTPAMALAA